jgi:hypothetical protein
LFPTLHYIFVTQVLENPKLQQGKNQFHHRDLHMRVPRAVAPRCHFANLLPLVGLRTLQTSTTNNLHKQLI